MDCKVVFVLLLAFRCALAGAEETQPAEHRQLIERIRARLDAAGAGDAVQWGAFVLDDCICGFETKAGIQKTMATRPPTVRNWYGELRGMQIRVLGDAAVARYRVAELTEVAGQRTSMEVWRTETFARRNGAWLLAAGAEVVITPDPVPVTVDARILASYVGRYEYTPGSVDTVTLEGARLFVQPSDAPRVEVFAESETTYFAKGEPWRIVFQKDAHGVVNALLFRQHAQEWKAVKLR